MVSKRWQRSNLVITHLGLAVGATFPLYIFEQDIDSWRKILIVILGLSILIPFIRKLHHRYAKTFIRVYRCDYEQAAKVIQRLLNAQRLAFAKQTYEDRIVFVIRSGNMQLLVDDFVLNMPIDDHLKPEIATKLTLQPETDENADQMEHLRQIVDETFAKYGW
jgi:hypothetical protein